MRRGRTHHASAIAALAGRLSAMGDNAVVREMRAEVDAIAKAATDLDAAHANHSPLMTPAAHAVKVAKQAREFDKQAAASLNRILPAYGRAQQDVERRILEKINLRPNEFASEIRTAFRHLNSKKKSELITQLVKEGRGPELAAIVEAPSVLTGIGDEEKARYKAMMVETHAADLLNELELIRSAFNEADTAITTAGQMVRALTDPNKLAEIERDHAAAAAADAAFAQSVRATADQSLQ